MTQVEHLIVLMLENRSFDHMLGFMDHPGSFEGIPPGLELPAEPNGSEGFPVTDDGEADICPDPDHSHFAVMRQLFLRDPISDRPADLGSATCDGFIWDYAKKIKAHGARCKGGPARPERIVSCFPRQLPASVGPYPAVLRRLATEFALCDHWHCSVPGETWPNRNFAHSGTSHGTVNIEIKPYTDPTVFARLRDQGLRAKVYQDGPAQAWAFPDLWLHGHCRSVKKFKRDVERDELPAYSFIEPRHLKLFAGYSNHQHPGSNPRDGRNFQGGEQLILDVYRTLLLNETVWNKSLLIITYDEHGGLFDHVPPPYSPNDYSGDYTFEDKNGYTFDFGMLGVRIPAVLVSPWISRGTVDSNVYDHTAIISTLRELRGIEPLGNRDSRMGHVLENLSGTLRPSDDVPRFDEEMVMLASELMPLVERAPIEAHAAPVLDDLQHRLLEQTAQVERGLDLAMRPWLTEEALIAELVELSVAGREPRFQSEEQLTTYLNGVAERVEARDDS